MCLIALNILDMEKLQFNGPLTIDQIFEDYKKEIYNVALKSIKENYKKIEIDEINVVKISTEIKDYSINLTRDKFIPTLNRCIEFFEPIEDYETCQECVNIINAIEHQKLTINI